MMPKTLNFLVVDDVASTRKLVIRELDFMGFTGDKLEADSSASAVEILEKKKNTPNPINFVISDWQLGEGVPSGLSLLLWIRKDSLLRSLPFMMVTKVSDKNNIVEAISLGVSNYLLKPWNRGDFQKKLKATWNHVHKK